MATRPRSAFYADHMCMLHVCVYVCVCVRLSFSLTKRTIRR